MPIKLPLISVNGVLDAAISPLDRGFTYGDGIFETCRYQSGEIPLWALHRDRLLGSASRLGIPLDESLLMATCFSWLLSKAMWVYLLTPAIFNSFNFSSESKASGILTMEAGLI